MKKIVLFLLAVAMLVGLFGCENDNIEMTDVQLVEAVKNAHFEKYSQKTIGEYCNLFEKNVLSRQCEEIQWFVDDGVVMFHYWARETNIRKEYTVYYFTFSYDKQDRKITLISVTVGMGSSRERFKTKQDLADLTEKFIKSAEKIV